MIGLVEQVKEKLGEPYRTVCRELDVPYSNVMRWRSRQMRGEAVVRKPGPAKAEPLDTARLHEDILQLTFTRKRTGGTTALCGRYQNQISRRDLRELVAAVRGEVLEEQKALERRIEWRVPGLVWSMDDAKNHWLEPQPYGHVHLLQDLGSRYKLKVLGDEVMACGERVAENLDHLFGHHGAPLFLKRDNGSNLNHHAVDGLLDEYGVIPLNSPPHYPPYNGGIERAQQEIRRELESRIGNEPVDGRTFRLECELSGHAVNHVRRRILGGRTACRTLEDGREFVRSFTRRKRKEVFGEIRNLAVDIMEALDEHASAAVETAFRYAAETWMQLNNIIVVTRNGEVLPPFYQIRSH